MPTVRRFSRCKLCIFTPDHPPPHFHLIAADFAAMVDLRTMRVLAGTVAGAEDAMAWAQAHRDDLLALWHQINPGRG